MRILHVIPGLRPAAGGPSRSVPALCEAISESGHHVEICTFRPPGCDIAPVNEAAVPVRYFEPLAGTAEFPTLSFYRELRKFAAGFDMVHLHGVWNPSISVVAHICHSINKPYVLSPLGMLRTIALRRRRLKKRLYWRLIARKIISGAGAIVVFTQLEARETAQSELVGDIQVIPNGIDPNLSQQVHSGYFIESFPVLKGKKIALFLGRLHWSKNLPLQFQAMRSVLEKTSDTMWVLVGPDEGEWNTLSKSIRNHGLEDRVLWTGLLDRDRCLQALKDSHVALLTSRHEGHSMAMNEALAVGIPVVLTESVGFDRIERAGAGFVVPNKAEDISGAVLRILNEPRLARRMCDAGQALVREHYTWNAVAQQHLAVYQHILARKRPDLYNLDPQPYYGGSLDIQRGI